jgi:hypothetical protein
MTAANPTPLNTMTEANQPFIAMTVAIPPKAMTQHSPQNLDRINSRTP